MNNHFYEETSEKSQFTSMILHHSMYSIKIKNNFGLKVKLKTADSQKGFMSKQLTTRKWKYHFTFYIIISTKKYSNVFTKRTKYI